MTSISVQKLTRTSAACLQNVMVIIKHTVPGIQKFALNIQAPTWNKMVELFQLSDYSF
jgi:hypothetical protein